MRALKGYWIGGLLAVVIVATATEWTIDLLKSNQIEHHRIDVLNRVVTLRARLEGEINSTLHLTRGLIAYVAINPEVDSDEFDALASEITAVGRNIRNIGQACRYLVKDFGTSESPRSTRQRDSRYAPTVLRPPRFRIAHCSRAACA
ncbi:MAG: hypothetical protein KZQ65_08005, partial [Candidatus Thiodiazotropha sp. (ex Gloverina cf. vestifex)]|nr:hypothetical protein [Candidatus Thiodiazotropha sp. (ex Gloverina cf. vestifex)]